MAALDREVAEEKAEVAESEVQKLGERVAELELELAVLKEENGELWLALSFELTRQLNMASLWTMSVKEARLLSRMCSWRSTTSGSRRR